MRKIDYNLFMRLIPLLCLSLLTLPALAQPTTQPIHSAAFQQTITKTIQYHYLVYLPKTYGHGRKVPVIILLHGSGSCGETPEDLQKLAPGPLFRYAQSTDDFPFAIIAPQAHSELEWWPVEPLNLWLDDVMKKYDFDPDRVYLTGISMGAYGVWDWACHNPERFAAIVPMAGEGNDDLAGRLQHVPVWAFHGEKDKAVSLAEEQRMVNAVNKHGGSAKLTIYPDLGHNVWSRAMQDPALYNWLLQYRRWNPPSPPQQGR
jgi:predicted peptidase